MKKASLTDVSSGYTSGPTFNQNFDKLNDRFENTLSRDGSSPNTMLADLDLNSNDILNVKSMDVSSLTLSGTKVTDVTAVPTWTGTWAPSTLYNKDTLASFNGSSYISVESHTSSSSFNDDLVAGRWELLAARGNPGAGTGDMVGANNLSDVNDPSVAASNLGLVKQVNPTDSTLGRILLNKAHGLGETVAAPQLSDFNDANVATGFKQFSGSTVGDRPAGMVNGVALVQRGSSGVVTQFVIQQNGSTVAYRTYAGGSWGAWDYFLTQSSKASKGDAESGVEDTKWMSSLNVKQAIDSQAFVARGIINGSTGNWKQRSGFNPLTRTGVGLHTVTFATTQPNTNYKILMSYEGSAPPTDIRNFLQYYDKTTTGFKIRTVNINNIPVDVPETTIVIFG